MIAVGRNTKPLTIDTTRPKRIELAIELTDLQSAANLATREDLATAADLKVGAVRRVLNAEAVPDEDVIRPTAPACKADVRTVRRLLDLWRDARLETRPTWYRPGLLATGDPSTIGNFAQVRDSMLKMLRDAGSPSLRILDERAGFGTLSRSSLERTLRGMRKPTRAELVAFVRVCDVYKGDPEHWGVAWDRSTAGVRQRVQAARHQDAGLDGLSAMMTPYLTDAIANLGRQTMERIRAQARLTAAVASEEV